MTIQLTDGQSTFCACGSGLRAVRCCSLEPASLLRADADQNARMTVGRAIAAHERGEIAQAEHLCQEVLERFPGEPGALAVLHQIKLAQGRNVAAEILIRRLLTVRPADVWATRQWALVLFEKGDMANAEAQARKAVRLAPEDPQSHNLMGIVMAEARRPEVSEHHFRRALDLAGERYPLLLANLARSLKEQGRIEEGRRLYEESLGLNGRALQTLLGYARLEEADRNFAGVHALLDRAERIAPGNPRIRLRRAAASMHDHPPEEVLTILRQRSDDHLLDSGELLEKGRLFDRLGRFDEAFAAFEAGKRRQREHGALYMGDHVRDLAARLKSFFTARRLRTLPTARPIASGPRPLFIVGFPRSGTTMVEQTLSGLPEIAAGDELPLIDEIVRLLPAMLESPLAYPEALADLWLGDRVSRLDNLRDYYVQRAHQLGAAAEGRRWFTDKMPLNEMHLGLIDLLFPQTPIIHLIRHPLDVVLSTFSNGMTHGFHCATALETIARHYVLVMDLVEHYRAEMKLNYLAVRYEDIVENQEASVRRLVDFVGVPFDPRCLAFHQNRRLARTASRTQVSQELYASSRYRYRNYLEHLAPVIPILEPVIRRLGYVVDIAPE